MLKGSRDISNVQRSSKGQECLKGAGMFNGDTFIGFRDSYTVQGCSKSAGMFNGSGIYSTSGMLIESCLQGAGMFQG